MRLSSEKVEKFYNLWLPLVSFANNEGKLATKLTMLSFGMNIKPADVLPTAEYIWNNHCPQLKHFLSNLKYCKPLM